MPDYKCDISFTCPKCGAKVIDRIDVPEPYWMADRASDMTAEGDLDLECRNCDEMFAASVINNAGDCDIKIHDHPLVTVDADTAFYDGSDEDDWEEPEPPDNAFSVFMRSHRETWIMLKENALPADGSSLMNRMVFAHQISAMEAFLADTAIIHVTTKPDAMNRLLEEDADLKKEKFNLAEIAADPNLVRKTVIEHLRSLMYHNIARVRVLYQTVLNIDLFKLLSKDELETLMRAVIYRHDCVHRNGHTKDGEKLAVFTPEYVEKIAGIAHSLVDGIEKKRIIDGFQATIDAITLRRSGT
ncbi:hypothetical protein [Bradyrhizobium sp. LA6.12]|uniref:hypothetical protein n=1 Tax=unclassified Bradyrhizobium TaxID=2631580 RepID=UPI003392E454